MTIASEISRLQQAKGAMKTAITNRGVPVGDSVKLDEYAGKINEISTGKEEAAAVQANLDAHTGNKNNPHGVTAAQVGAAVPSTVVNATLTTSGWTGSGPYTQTVTVNGMTTTKNGSIGLAANATAAQREAARDAMLAVTGQGANSITITADGDKPTESLPVAIVLLG